MITTEPTVLVVSISVIVSNGVSASTSFNITLKLFTRVSSTTVKESALAVGGSFTEIVVIVTLAVLDRADPSLAL